MSNLDRTVLWVIAIVVVAPGLVRVALLGHGIGLLFVIGVLSLAATAAWAARRRR